MLYGRFLFRWVAYIKRTTPDDNSAVVIEAQVIGDAGLLNPQALRIGFVQFAVPEEGLEFVIRGDIFRSQLQDQYGLVAGHCRVASLLFME